MKCLSCGLTNFATDTTCRRCGTSIDSAIPAADGTWQPMSTVQGWNSASPAYDVPPAYGGTGASGYGAYVPVPQLAGIWRDGDALVVHRNALLPDRCVKCNAPAEGGRLRRRFAWHHPAIYFLLLAGLLVYAIVALIVQKKAVLDLGICVEHRRRRRMLLLAAWGLLIAGIVLIPVAFRIGSGFVALMSGASFLGALVTGYLVSNWITVSKIDDSYVWLGRVDPAYRAGYPAAH